MKLANNFVVDMRISLFYDFEQSNLRVVSGNTEKYFNKMREVMFKHISNNNKVFHFSQRCYNLGDTGMSFSPIFIMQNFPVLYMFLECRFSIARDVFQKNQERFFFKTN